MEIKTTREDIDNRNTRVFFVVDSHEDNPEIFDKYGDAIDYYQQLSKEDNPRVYIAMVRNSYFEIETGWNYEDLSNTFHFIIGMDVR